ncbi:hypothetical protein FBZ96_101356 [Bradyrhizobium stylosanthis]|uniref:Uncharacterized protein n=1 Tax=Bradyrhizobium stylosanthis TaxID=1803665 RepID=A0A560EB03_9BRAD|nr:hypothetical protein FBZ96_101356 [Bradyrhizobium stylosanthis]
MNWQLRVIAKPHPVDMGPGPRAQCALGRDDTRELGDNEERSYAAPMMIPTASTMAPPSTIWNTAWRNGVSM